MPSRHFPPPWVVDDSDDACFIVRDKNRHTLAYIYYELVPRHRGFDSLNSADLAVGLG